MIKRIFDILVASFGLLLASPILLPVMLLVWLQDYHSPFYVALRIGKDGKPFKMMKIRSMVVNAEKTGVDSTASDDKRITAVGRFIRAYKIDEISQLINVVRGDMSLVGPRPNVQRDVALYTEVEKKLLSVKPGITDISSIVFSDEGEILQGSQDPDLRYNQVIRPWKSRLGLLYIEKQSLKLDIQLIWTTVIAILSRQDALEKIQVILQELNADEQLKRIAKRQEMLMPYPPPGAASVVTARS